MASGGEQKAKRLQTSAGGHKNAVVKKGYVLETVAIRTGPVEIARGNKQEKDNCPVYQ